MSEQVADRTRSEPERPGTTAGPASRMRADRRTYRLELEYDGTAFGGWARQPGRRTVQGEVERALATFLRRPVAVRVAGRTDAGVHASAQVASFAAESPLDLPRLRLGLNALLPPDVAVRAVTEAPEGFDARAAVARTYRYRLWLAPARPVLERAFVWHLHATARHRGAAAGGIAVRRAARLERADAVGAGVPPLRARGHGGALAASDGGR